MWYNCADLMCCRIDVSVCAGSQATLCARTVLSRGVRRSASGLSGSSSSSSPNPGEKSRWMRLTGASRQIVYGTWIRYFAMRISDTIFRVLFLSIASIHISCTLPNVRCFSASHRHPCSSQVSRRHTSRKVRSKCALWLLRTATRNGLPLTTAPFLQKVRRSDCSISVWSEFNFAQAAQALRYRVCSRCGCGSTQ